MLITALKGYSQPFVPKDIGVLRVQLNNSKPDTARVRLLVELGRYYNRTAVNSPALIDSAMAAASRAQKLSNLLAYTRGSALSYQALARTWCNKKNFKKADELIQKAIQVFLDQNLYRDAAEACLDRQEFYVASGGQDMQVRIKYYEQALPLFMKAGAKVRAGETLQSLGDFYQLTGNITKAIEDLKQSLALFQSVKYPYLQGVYDLLGYVYMQKSNFKDGLKYGLLAVKAAENVGDSTMQLSTIYNRVGLVYFATYQYDLSTYYARKSLHLAEKYHDVSVVFIVANLAGGLIKQNKLNEALHVLKENDKKHPDIDRENRIILDGLYLTVDNLLNRNTEADTYCKKLLAYYHSADQGGSQKNFILNMITRYYVAIGQYQLARQYVPEFIRISKTNSSKRPLLFAYQRRYMIDSAERQYAAAFKGYQQYVMLRDSVSESTKNKQLQELQIEYETNQKEKENIFLKKENLLQQNKAKQANYVRNLTLTGIFILLVFVALLYYSFHINQKNSKKISEKNISLNKLVTEKEWLLKEIHHRVKNNLQIVMGLLQRQSAYIDNDHALAAIRNSENRMHSIALIHQKLYQADNLDLIFMPEYMGEMIGYLKDSCGLENRIFFEKQIDDIYLDVAQAVPLGLILNEAITNSIKYAYPGHASGVIYISMIEVDDRQIELTIADNGPGLPAAFNLEEVDSLGINLIKGLSKQMGATCDIANEEGCVIQIRFKTEIFNRETTKAEITLS